MFWGMRYTPARILNPEKDIVDYVWEQAQPSDMLFCLHHRLLHAHKKERPEIERLVRVTGKDRFTLLGTACNLTNGKSCDPLGDDLLKYLYKASHNMLHFACHCNLSHTSHSPLADTTATATHELQPSKGLQGQSLPKFGRVNRV